jgi:glutamate decarboxylase
MVADAQVALENLPDTSKSKLEFWTVARETIPDSTQEAVKQNTIGVFVVMGSTYAGHYEPVEEISKILDHYEAKTGVIIPVHVDTTRGVIITPFTYARAGGPKDQIGLYRAVAGMLVD